MGGLQPPLEDACVTNIYLNGGTVAAGMTPQHAEPAGHVNRQRARAWYIAHDGGA
jgi:hypothetical protein